MYIGLARISPSRQQEGHDQTGPIFARIMQGSHALMINGIDCSSCVYKCLNNVRMRIHGSKVQWRQGFEIPSIDISARFKQVPDSSNLPVVGGEMQWGEI
ncbi:MAG: hypothetical protein BWY76_00202 [bacterium ADurb.Bin429]|nr:MAG: hypothetical protein BWY76_00202 [bacterium ADurb.Bin429]